MVSYGNVNRQIGRFVTFSRKSFSTPLLMWKDDNMLVMVTLGARIRDLRKHKGLTQEELAEEMHVSRPAVARWESDNTSPDHESISAMADFFEVSTDYLLGRTDDREQPICADTPPEDVTPPAGMKHVGERLAELRTRLGRTVEDVADDLQVAPEIITRHELTGYISKPWLVRYAEYYRVDPRSFFQPNDDYQSTATYQPSLLDPPLSIDDLLHDYQQIIDSGYDHDLIRKVFAEILRRGTV